MFENLVSHIQQNYKQENIDFFNKLCTGRIKKIKRKKKKEYDITLNDYKSDIPCYNDFYILETQTKDSFIESILIHLYKNFYNFDLNEKKRLIIEFRKYLSYNISTFLKSNKNISRKFGKKGYLQEKLLNFSKILINEPYINKYIANLMNINIYVFSDKCVNVDYSEKEFVSKFKPTLFLECKNDDGINKFNTLSHHNFELLKYSNNFGKLLDNLFNKYGNKYIIKQNIPKQEPKQEPNNEQINEQINVNKMKVTELREYVVLLGINIKKKSEKTNKMIYKLKNELLSDIKKLDSIKTI